MAHQVYLLLLIVFYSLNQAANEVYHITTNSESAQIDLCTAPCLTLSEFMISLGHYLSFSNTTLVFFPGTHYLTVNVSVSNLDQFSMTSDHESITAKVVCKNYSHIRFNYSQHISISNLEFIGCGGNQVEHVEEFTVKNAKFEGQNASSTALEIIETVTQIANSTFKFNRRGKFKNGKILVGGAIIVAGCEINISQSRYEINEAEDGGAIYAEDSIVVMSNSRFTNNSADIRGGVLFSLRSIVTIIGSYFDINTAREDGGVIFSIESIITIETSKFDGNAAVSRSDDSGGGVMYSYNGTILIETSEFDNNTANTNSSGAGGGVLYSFIDNITIRASKFDGNTAISKGDFSGGGVMYSEECTITVETSEFDNNTANTNGRQAGGGVLYFYRDNNITIRASKFDGNTAISRGIGSGGGVMYLAEECTITVEISEFNNNTANTNGINTGGGVLHSFRDNITIRASKFDGNTATSRGFSSGGGVMYLAEECTITVEISEIDNNTANTNGSIAGGGVLYSFFDHITIRASKFDGNTATSRGDYSGGGVMYLAPKCTILVETSEFNNNTADTNGILAGGGVLHSFIDNDITIRASKFDGNTAISRGDFSGGGVMYSEECTITVETSEFDNNTANTNGSIAGGGVLYSFIDNITIKASKFDRNTAISSSGYGGFGGILFSYYSNIAMKANKFNYNTARRGGVLYCIECSILIVANRFYNNSATSYGGALYCILSTITIEVEKIAVAYERSFNPGDGNDVTNNTKGAVAYTKDMNDSLQVVNNGAGCGVIFLSTSELYVKYSGSLTLSNNMGSLVALNSKIILIGSVEFRNNSRGLLQQSEGGAMTLLQSNIYFNGSCSLHHNLAEDGGALLSIESKLYVNGDVTIARNTASSNGGGVYLSANSELNCQEKSTFLLTNNFAGQKGGGLHAISSFIKATSVRNASTEARLHFTKNRAKMGGGLSLDANAKLYIILLNYDYYNHQDTQTDEYFYTVAFIGNSADTYGGAVYVDDETNPGTCTNSSKMECFFQVLDVSIYKSRQLTRSIYFSQNHANISGSTLYGGMLDRCAVSQFQVLFEKNSGVAYFKRISIPTYKTTDGEEVFAATNISISSGPVKVCLCIKKKHNCSHQGQTQVKKGEAFNVSLVAVDQIEQPVNATIDASLQFPESGLSEGQLRTKIQGECTNLTFNVVSPHKYENLTLYASDGPCKDADPSRMIVETHFLPCTCPIGFQISGKNETNCICDCHSSIGQYTEHCDSHTGSFIINSNSRAWISYINDTNVIGYLVYQNCPFDYCNSLSLPVDLNLPNGADAQCAFNRSSLLCGSCRPGLSLSLGSSRCLQCPSHWPTLLAGITLAAILAGIALVALLLVLNMTVAVGTLNGLIFYANVVYANKSILLPFRETSIVTAVISFLNLELGVDTCYFPGMDTYIKTWLQLAFPAFVFYLVILVIAVSSYSIRFSKLIGNKNPVATLATLILLSYAKLLQICFESLSVGILKYPDGSSKALWLPDATVSYLQGKHIPLFITAVLILLVGLIYTAILFLWQWRFYLPRWKIFTVCLRSQKLQFFIETYHAPFKPKHHYWTGLLLIARAILYLVAAANISNDPQLDLSAIVFITISIVILMAFINIQMYKKMPINILETFFVLNLLFFSVFTWYSLSGVNINQKAVAYTSVLITFTILMLIILYHVYTYTSIFSKLRKMDLSRMINKFRADPRIRARHHQRSPPDDSIHRFNELLDMITGPANTNDYNVPLLDQQPVEPTYSVVELPKPQHTNEPVPEEAIIRNVPGPGVTAC